MGSEMCIRDRSDVKMKSNSTTLLALSDIRKTSTSAPPFSSRSGVSGMILIKDNQVLELNHYQKCDLKKIMITLC